MNARTAAAALAAVVLVASPLVASPAEDAAAAGTTYHFGTSPARTTILFESETSLETIHGVCRAMSGTAVLDFEKGEGTATLTVPVKSLETGMASRDEHLRGADWLDEAKFPDIVFIAKSLKRVKSDDAKKAGGGDAAKDRSDEATKKETWAYEGEITIHGVTKPLKGEATVQRIPAEIGRKLGAGEWVKVKTAFPVTIAEFDIKVPDVAAAKVAPTWDVKVDIFGTTAPPPEKK